MKAVLCLGGSDPSMGAGVQMDTAVCRALGVVPRVVETMFTQQGELGLESVELRDMVDIAHDILHTLDDGVQAIKIGALGDARIVEAVAAALEPWHDAIPIVLDPVAAASKSKTEVYLNTREGVRLMESTLFPLAAVVTPNLLEFGNGERYRNCQAILRKGGHTDTFAEMEGRGPSKWLADVLELENGDSFEYRHTRVLGGQHLHGTGCALSTAIACGLANGNTLSEACHTGIGALQVWIKAAMEGGHDLRPIPPSSSS